MDAGYIERNVADCEAKIKSLQLRIKKAKGTASFEDQDRLKSELGGDKATLKKLTAKE
jgi:hypothetical protein